MKKNVWKLGAVILCAALLLTGCGKEKKPSPSSQSTGESHAVQQPESMPESDSESKPESSTASKPESDPESKPESSSASKPESSSASKSESASSKPESAASSQKTARAATVRADGGLRLRKAADANSDKITTIPDGTRLTCTEWKQGWVKTTYNGNTGWVSAVYLLFDGQVKADGGLRLRSGPGTNHEKLLTIPNGTLISCMEQKDSWIKTTYGGKTGWVSQEFVQVPVTVYASKGLNMREKPDKTSAKITVIPNGTRVICRGNKENEWALVEYNGKLGYVSYLYIAYD